MPGSFRITIVECVLSGDAEAAGKEDASIVRGKAPEDQATPTKRKLGDTGLSATDKKQTKLKPKFKSLLSPKSKAARAKEAANKVREALSQAGRINMDTFW